MYPVPQEGGEGAESHQGSQVVEGSLALSQHKLPIATAWDRHVHAELASLARLSGGQGSQGFGAAEGVCSRCRFKCRSVRRVCR